MHKDGLLFVTLAAIGRFLRAECLGSVVAMTAVLAFIHFLHGHLFSALLHFEECRMAVIALVYLMNISAKGNLTLSPIGKLERLSGTDRENRGRQS
jgi:hypothetical protein